VIDAGEACDDGNTDKEDGCDASCQLEQGFSCKGAPSVCKTTCGDGKLGGAEGCDDGNIVGGDGCSTKCVVEPGFTCDGMPSKCTSTCGDGIIGGDEACDDSNASPGDGCSATCLVEKGFACMGEPSICTTDCGDGVVAGAETCDDGNLKNTDGCNASCQAEQGFTCTGAPSVCVTTCGDGAVAGVEPCDDGNLTNGDGCSGVCVVEAGYLCAGSPSACTPICGDGVLLAPEACDDGNLDEGDGCSATCTVQPGYKCSGTPSVCTPICGDGIVSPPEACDDGNVANGDGCNATCSVQMGFKCMGAPSQCTAICGDGVKLGAEACDDGNTKNADGCSATCGLETGFNCAGAPSVCTAICGDGMKLGAEACDDGNMIDTDCCNSACQLLCEVEPNDTPAQAVVSGSFAPSVVIKSAINPANDGDYYPIKLPTRTDLLVQTFDGTGPNNCNNVDTLLDLIAPDGTTVLASNDDVSGAISCSRIDPATTPAARSLDPGVYYAKVTPFSAGSLIPAYTLRFTFVAVCGNGVVEGSEECDGNGGPPCDASCQRVPSCGDGFTDAPETCDDANMINADGCTACALNPGYLCAGSPSVCAPICGDNMKIGAEQCDDGNTAVGDGCDSACRTEQVLVESEANDSVAQANLQPVNLNAQSNVVSGAIGAIGDKDLFKVTLAANSVIRLETFGPSGNDCPPGMSTTLRLLNAGGVELYNDSIKGIDNCSALEVNAAVGTYYAQVEKAQNNGLIAAYKLEVKIQPSKGSEIEPNGAAKTATAFVGSDVTISGSHQVAGDADFYAIVVPPGRSIRAEVIEGGAETCESQGVDSYLELYDSEALLIATDDDSGRTYCSAIDGTGSLPFYPTAHGLPGGTYYLALKASPFAVGPDAQFDYKIALTVR
jgi:cysteine-rich repeat protein